VVVEDSLKGLARSKGGIQILDPSNGEEVLGGVFVERNPDMFSDEPTVHVQGVMFHLDKVILGMDAEEEDMLVAPGVVLEVAGIVGNSVSIIGDVVGLSDLFQEHFLDCLYTLQVGTGWDQVRILLEKSAGNRD